MNNENTLKYIRYEFINNNINYCKNSLRHLIYDNIYKKYENTLFGEAKNFKELYSLIENSKQFKNKIKKHR